MSLFKRDHRTKEEKTNAEYQSLRERMIKLQKEYAILLRDSRYGKDASEYGINAHKQTKEKMREIGSVWKQIQSMGPEVNATHKAGTRKEYDRTRMDATPGYRMHEEGIQDQYSSDLFIRKKGKMHVSARRLSIRPQVDALRSGPPIETQTQGVKGKTQTNRLKNAWRAFRRRFIRRRAT
jgi:hypothetical protein